MSAGKGDKPRNCYTKKYRVNYDCIIWAPKNKKKKGSCKSGQKTLKYY